MKKSNKNPRKKTSSAYAYGTTSLMTSDTTTITKDPTTISTITTTHLARK